VPDYVWSTAPGNLRRRRLGRWGHRICGDEG
jgi:hypothetical protein